MPKRTNHNQFPVGQHQALDRLNREKEQLEKLSNEAREKIENLSKEKQNLEDTERQLTEEERQLRTIIKTRERRLKSLKRN